MRGTAAGLAAFASLGAVLAAPTQAEAKVDQLYVGVFQHNGCLTNCKNAFKEPEPNIEVEADFSDLQSWTLLHHPRPYVMASINTQGATSYAGAGLTWTFHTSPRWSIDPGLGIIVHNGELNNKYANGTPQAAQFFQEHVLLGSRELFRVTLGVTHQINDHWSAQGYYEHLSHGQILGHGRNQGLDEFGLRVGYHFGPRD